MDGAGSEHSPVVVVESEGGPVSDQLTAGEGIDQVAAGIGRASDERYVERGLTALIEATDDVIWMLTPDWEAVSFVNAAYESVWGRPVESLQTDPLDFLQGVHPEDRERVRDAMVAVSGGETAQLEFRVNEREDFQRWVDVRGMPIRDEHGEIVRIAGLARDVTARKAHERRLEALQERTKTLMETSTRQATAQEAVDIAHGMLGAPLSGFHLLSDDGRRLEPLAFVDTVREELGEPPVYERDAEDDPAATVVWEAFESGDPLVIEDTRHWGRLSEVTPARSGLIYPLDDHGVFIVSGTGPGQFDATDRTLLDILATTLTAALDRVERERTLQRQNERLEDFVNVVSHDLRNPLNVASGRLELVQEDCESPHIEKVQQAHARMDALISDLLTLARVGDAATDPVPVELGAIATECWANVETTGGRLVVETDRTVRADPSQLQQLLENLFRNSVEHGAEESSDSEVRIRIGESAEGFYVADDGPGIPPDERENVFEAGYSTEQEGTGFGLSIVKRIANAHGWTVAVAESDRGGVRFDFEDVRLA
jgi:PAS domain S-box-containing protein